MHSEDRETQLNELMVLESIFTDDREKLRRFDTDEDDEGDGERGLISGVLSVQVQLPLDVRVTVLAQVAGQAKTVQVENLSPVSLDFVLPANYPSSVPPEFTLNAVWLDAFTISKLQKRLKEVWTENEGMPVLYLWMQTIRDETITSSVVFDLDKIAASQTRGKRRDSGSLSGEQRLTIIAGFDEMLRRRQFETGWYPCEVCLLEKAGRDCIDFYPCRHIFCCACVGGYFSVQIADGAVRQLHCLADKCSSEATQQQVRLAVSSEQYEQYERLLLNDTLALMSDAVTCPRPSCQAPVLLDIAAVSADDAASATAVILPAMATCSYCSFTFCNQCRKGYHGVQPCDYNKQDRGKLLKEYQNADPETRKQLERRLGGKKKLDGLVNEFLAQQWIGDHSKKCPKCRVDIEKQDGCNKMHCSKCGTLFCWLCMRELSSTDPYAHFNNPGDSACFNQLFQGVVMDDDDIDDL